MCYLWHFRQMTSCGFRQAIINLILSTGQSKQCHVEEVILKLFTLQLRIFIHFWNSVMGARVPSACLSIYVINVEVAQPKVKSTQESSFMSNAFFIQYSYKISRFSQKPCICFFFSIFFLEIINKKIIRSKNWNPSRISFVRFAILFSVKIFFKSINITIN